MITDFEQELAAYLNTHLEAPLAGRVSVSDGDAKGGGAHPAILVGVTRTAWQPAEMGPRHGEVVPGSPDLRRVLRLVCAAEIGLYPSSSGKRNQEISGMEQIAYLLDAPEVRNGKAFEKQGDQGFIIHSLQVTGGSSPLLSGGPAATGLTLEVRGWFWPKGRPGQTGIAIARIRLRGVGLTLSIAPSPAVLRAGGPPREFSLSLPATGPLALTESGAASAGPLGTLYCTIRTRDGSSPLGTLSGGVAALDGGRLIELAGEEALLTYTPGAQATVEDLVIALENGESGEGIELVRVPVETIEGT
ncbi:MAG: hypothetical protein RBR16_04230 [Syntrophus sp. (in: bacteria)]|nr:hypothetical protein [Syntrophus sp. (in: bacteria)]